MATTVTYIYIILGMFSIALLLWYLLWYRKFNKTVIVRELTGNGAMLIKFDKARSFIDSENTEKWQLWQEKGVIIPPPPADATEITTKGSKFAELYKLGDYKFVWVVDNHTPESIEALLEAEDKLKFQTGKISTEQTWKPISASAKMAWLNQTRKSIAMRGKGLAEKIAQLMPYVAIIIVLFVGYMMWDSQNQANIKITESVTSAVGQMSAVSEKMADASNRLVDQLEGKQAIGPQPIIQNNNKPVIPN
jgi:hypothetical protein